MDLGFELGFWLKLKLELGFMVKFQSSIRVNQSSGSSVVSIRARVRFRFKARGSVKCRVVLV